MKRTLALLAILVGVAGCSSFPSFARPIVPVTRTNTVVLALTNTVPEVHWRTNLLMVTNLVAGERVVLTNFVERIPVIVTNLEVRIWTNITVITNGFTTNPDFASAIETARGINSGFNPTPAGPFVDWGLKLVVLAAGALAAWKTRKQNQTQGILQTAEDVRNTLIMAIETAPPEIVAAIKKRVADISKIRENSTDVHDAVKSITT